MREYRGIQSKETRGGGHAGGRKRGRRHERELLRPDPLLWLPFLSISLIYFPFLLFSLFSSHFLFLSFLSPTYSIVSTCLLFPLLKHIFLPLLWSPSLTVTPCLLLYTPSSLFVSFHLFATFMSHFLFFYHVLLVSHSISSSVSFLVFIPDFLSSYVSCHPFLPFHFLLPLLLFTSPDFFFPFFSFSPTVSPLLFLLIVISLINVHLIPLFFPFLISSLYPLVFTCVYSSSWSLLSPFASSPMVFLFISRFRSILFTLLSSWFISSCVLSFPFFPCFLLRFVFSSVCPPYLFFPHLIFVLSSISMLCFLSLC